MTFNEFHVEDVALEWFEELGYVVGHGSQFAPGEPAISGGDDSLPVQLDEKRVTSVLEVPFTNPDSVWKLP